MREEGPEAIGEGRRCHRQDGEEDGAGHSSEEIATAGAKIGERAGDKLAQRVGYRADRGDEAEANLCLAGRDAVLRKIVNESREYDR